MATVDQLTILGSLIGLLIERPIYAHGIYPWYWAMLILSRGSYIYAAAMSYFRYDVLIRGKGLHKEFGLAFAGLALILIHGARASLIYDAISLVGVVSGVMAGDVIFAYRRIVKINHTTGDQPLILETFGGNYRPVEIKPRT
ncbi:MAG: hypothetical protein ABIS59_00480 [Candidatus Saccharibacteria bacterium]